MNATDKRRWLPFAHKVAQCSVRDLSLWAQGLIKRYAEKRKPASPRKIEKKKERLIKKGETAELREAVFARADGKCELCLPWLTCRAIEMHHLESGRGRRLKLQALENCVAVCWVCHRSYHKRAEDFRGSVLAWCAKYKYPIPSRFRSAA